MSETAVVATPIKISKKDIRKAIQEKLLFSLADYRSIVGEKKFDSRIRKTARTLGQAVVKAMPKKKKEKAKVKELKEKSS